MQNWMNIFLQMHILNNLVAFRAEPVFVELEKKNKNPECFLRCLGHEHLLFFFKIGSTCQMPCAEF